MIKPSLPKGTRDFSSKELVKRNYVIDILKNTFEKFGFEPLETPAFEKLEVLTGKYGEEGDKLIFKILNSGDFTRKIPEDIYQSKDYKKLTPYLSEKALRYDLTIPLARYVAMHKNELVFPYKRYQIQPVWRADRPQKGRFREFMQCDADMLGSQSLWQEVELIELYNEVFKQLRLPVTIRVNNRKILNDIISNLDLNNYKNEILVILDKQDKIGWEKVLEEWIKTGVSEKKAIKLLKILSFEGHNKEKIDFVKQNIGLTEGLKEMETVFNRAEGTDFANLKIDLSLARGLDYYTGTIFEVQADGVQIGSVGGGGRYDDLTAVFGVKNVSGIGISFGLDRIILAMDEKKLFDKISDIRPDILFVNFGETESEHAWERIKHLRKNHIKAELYPDTVKLKKQFQYAHKRSIPYVAIVGEEEIKNHSITLKNMLDGTQKSVDINQLLQILTA